jgi:hypothetical protein
MKLINLTNHTINIILNGDNAVISIPCDPNVEPVRVETSQKQVAKVDGIPVMKTIYQDSRDARLPGPAKDTLYIVSSLTAMCHPDRCDLVSPNVHPSACIRDENHNIVAVRSLQCFWTDWVHGGN